MEILIWSSIFIVSVAALVKAARWISLAAQRVAGGDTESDFAVAAVAAALPELALATAAVLQDRPELAAAIVIGSSLANILMVIGASALAAKKITIKNGYFDEDLPFFAAGIALFYLITRDGQIVFYEGLLMLGAFFVYAVSMLAAPRRMLTPRGIITPQAIKDGGVKLMEFVGARIERNLESGAEKYSLWKISLMIAGGAMILIFASHFAVDSLANVSSILLVPAAVMAMFVLGFGAALPELSENLAVIRRKQHELALGNIFASTAVNLFLVVGMAAMLAPLPVDGAVLFVGLPFMIAAAVLLAVSAFSRRISSGQGLIFLLVYFLFFAKLFNLF